MDASLIICCRNLTFPMTWPAGTSDSIESLESRVASLSLQEDQPGSSAKIGHKTVGKHKMKSNQNRFGSKKTGQGDAAQERAEKYLASLEHPKGKN